MKQGTTSKTFQVFIYFQSGDSKADTRRFKTQKGALRRMKRLQAENRAKATCVGDLCDYRVC